MWSWHPKLILSSFKLTNNGDPAMPFLSKRTLSNHLPIRNKIAKRRLLFEAMESRCLLAYSFTSIDVPGASTSPAYGINDAGQIVGYYEAAGFHGFLKTGANFAALDATSLGATGTFAQRINNGGDIVGTYHRANHLHAFLMQNGGAYSEILVPGASSANALGINDSGQIVGNYNPSSGADLQERRCLHRWLPSQRQAEGTELTDADDAWRYRRHARCPPAASD